MTGPKPQGPTHPTPTGPPKADGTGSPWPARPQTPTSPGGPGRAELLDTAALLLGSVQLLVDRKFGDAFAHSPAELGEVKHSLKFLRRALEDLGAHSLPARRDVPRAALGLRADSMPGGPGPHSSREGTATPHRLGGVPGVPQPSAAVDVPAGRPGCKGRVGGAPGAATQTFTLPRPPEFQIGTAAITRT